MALIKSKMVLSTIACALVLQAGACTNQILPLIDQLGQTGAGSTKRLHDFYDRVNQIHSQINIDYQDIGKDPPDLPTSSAMNSSSLSVTDQSAISKLLIESSGEIGTSRTGPYYPKDVISARVKCGSLLETYAVKLRLLANSTSAVESQTAVADLQDRLKVLGDTVSQLKYPDAKAAGTQIQKMGNIVLLANMGAQAIVKYFREKWSHQVVENNNKIVDEICVALSDDCKLTSKRVRSRLSGLQNEYQFYYASNESKQQQRDESQHQKYMTELQKISSYQLQIESDNPSDLYDTFRLLHSRLFQEIAGRADHG